MEINDIVAYRYFAVQRKAGRRPSLSCFANDCFFTKLLKSGPRRQFSANC